MPPFAASCHRHCGWGGDAQCTPFSLHHSCFIPGVSMHDRELSPSKDVASQRSPASGQEDMCSPRATTAKRRADTKAASARHMPRVCVPMAKSSLASRVDTCDGVELVDLGCLGSMCHAKRDGRQSLSHKLTLFFSGVRFLFVCVYDWREREAAKRRIRSRCVVRLCVARIVLV